jgi:hypothetical protein
VRVDFLLVALLVGAIMVLAPLAAIVSLFTRTDEQVAGGSRVLWALVILVIPFAWLVYFLFGRRAGGTRLRA